MSTLTLEILVRTPLWGGLRPFLGEGGVLLILKNRGVIFLWKTKGGFLQNRKKIFLRFFPLAIFLLGRIWTFKKIISRWCPLTGSLGVRYCHIEKKNRHTRSEWIGQHCRFFFRLDGTRPCNRRKYPEEMLEKCSVSKRKLRENAICRVVHDGNFV